MESAPYILEKLIWSDADFEQMGWHDAYVHAIAAIPENFELLFDLDYIVQWISPVTQDEYLTFLVAPATLVFRNVWNIELHLESQSGEFSLQNIDRLDEQTTPNEKMTDWLWKLDGNEGSLSFRSTGYKQYFRRQPILTKFQQLKFEERDGICFSRTVPSK
ncbi:MULTISPECIES: hypothetical protein [Cyanophyceae]|uniref:hypothetical protein n=1 Tax=Cyanophyceae TaxID=3028117 RepID=UPI001685F14E|nr:hypothetical protein [Trichocoleus sp. FACHB-69]MBD1935650.1 hypothetical protein [Trichocoleus sp. FACHB-69]